MTTSKVITFQSPSGDTCSLAKDAIRALKRAGKWPRNARGEEYCTVSHGLHAGEPDMQLMRMADGRRVVAGMGAVIFVDSDSDSSDIG